MGERDYLVSGYLTISVIKTIRARSASEARKKAEGLGTPALCHQCSSAGDNDDGVWELNYDFDDPPDDCVKDVEVAKDG